MRPSLPRPLPGERQRYEERAENKVPVQHLPSSCIPGGRVRGGDLSAPRAMRWQDFVRSRGDLVRINAAVISLMTLEFMLGDGVAGRVRRSPDFLNTPPQEHDDGVQGFRHAPLRRTEDVSAEGRK